MPPPIAIDSSVPQQATGSCTEGGCSIPQEIGHQDGGTILLPDGRDLNVYWPREGSTAEQATGIRRR